VTLPISSTLGGGRTQTSELVGRPVRRGGSNLPVSAPGQLTRFPVAAPAAMMRCGGRSGGGGSAGGRGGTRVRAGLGQLFDFGGQLANAGRRGQGTPRHRSGGSARCRPVSAGTLTADGEQQRTGHADHRQLTLSTYRLCCAYTIDTNAGGRSNLALSGQPDRERHPRPPRCDVGLSFDTSPTGCQPVGC